VELADEVTEELCPNCSRNLVIKMGRYGKFLACPGFPECRYTRPLLEPTGVKCPECTGELVLRRSKKGRTFYGCSQYPQCEFSVWDRPSPEKCPVCGGLMVVKKYGKKESLKCVGPICSTREKAETEPAKNIGKKTKKAASSKASADSKRNAKGAAVVVGGDNSGNKKASGKIATGRSV